MSKTCPNLIAEVQQKCGREGDTVLVTEENVMGWLNDAQVEIVEANPFLLCMNEDCTSLTFQTDGLRYNVSDLTTKIGDNTDARPAHIHSITLRNGSESVSLAFLPWDEFEQKYPDFTSSDYNEGEPRHWTRYGDMSRGEIRIFPSPDSDATGKTMQVNVTWYPKDFSDVDVVRVSNLLNADRGLVDYALKEAWAVIGGEYGPTETLKWEAKYMQWLENYGAKNSRLVEWDANLYTEY